MMHLVVEPSSTRPAICSYLTVRRLLIRGLMGGGRIAVATADRLERTTTSLRLALPRAATPTDAHANLLPPWPLTSSSSHPTMSRLANRTYLRLPTGPPAMATLGPHGSVRHKGMLASLKDSVETVSPSLAVLVRLLHRRSCRSNASAEPHLARSLLQINKKTGEALAGGIERTQDAARRLTGRAKVRPSPGSLLRSLARLSIAALPPSASGPAPDLQEELTPSTLSCGPRRPAPRRPRRMQPTERPTPRPRRPKPPPASAPPTTLPAAARLAAVRPRESGAGRGSLSDVGALRDR
jgi:hypothetical protein